MLCGARSPNNYICTLPRNHIEEESYALHIATPEGYEIGRCDCPNCVLEFIEYEEVLDEWEDYQSYRRDIKPKQNPPDLRTAKAARLP